MDYRRLLNKYDDMRVYSIVVTEEFMEEVALDIGKVMNISVDENKIKKAFESEVIIGEERVCYFEDEEDKKCFILLDCCDADYLYSVIVGCKDIQSQKVKNVLLKWYKIVREGYGQKSDYELPDWMHNNRYDEKFNPLINTLRINKLIP